MVLYNLAMNTRSYIKPPNNSGESREISNGRIEICTEIYNTWKILWFYIGYLKKYTGNEYNIVQP